jgi:hypothetical protein
MVWENSRTLGAGHSSVRTFQWHHNYIHILIIGRAINPEIQCILISKGYNFTSYNDHEKPAFLVILIDG